MCIYSHSLHSFQNRCQLEKIITKNGKHLTKKLNENFKKSKRLRTNKNSTKKKRKTHDQKLKKKKTGKIQRKEQRNKQRTPVQIRIY